MITETDIETLESLCEAAARSGHIQTAIDGWALILRLRTALNMTPGEPLTARRVAMWEVEAGN